MSDIQRLHALFDLVVDLPPEQRETEIARATADAPEVANELRALLAHAARTDSPLDSAAVQFQEEIDEPPPPNIPGYRIHRRIGRGGSATVYLADQERVEFTRAVALKVVDRIFDAGSLRSVREEQRILARLEHPGISRLYDAGVTATGQPWLAMEHVEGESILAHCRSRDLPPPARIELFLAVLDAVAYAHARGIVHRDLKPANIFVDANGDPRLLDFGIAKLSDPADQDETRTLQRSLTPTYASPEQMRGDRTTAASDIYSLGVVLHELLTGALPGATTDDAPRGDLGAILAKALRERPEERYASANALADDLRRLLAGTPAAARREHRRHRVRELLGRHRVAAAAAAIVLVVAASWLWRDTQARKPAAELAVFHDAKPVDFETRRWLRDGAARLARFDGIGARDSFRRALASSKGHMPGEALAWDGVARAEESLGEVGRAAEAARRAGTLIAADRDALPAHEAERLHALALAANRDWNRAIPALEALFGAQPERVDIGLDLVRTLAACGRTDAADTTLGRLRQLAPSREGDPRIDLQEAEVAQQLSEYQRAAAVASRARRRAAAMQAVAIEQRAARLHAEASMRLDRREEARRALEALVTRNAALGLHRETAAAQLGLGTVLFRIGKNDEAKVAFEAGRDGCVRAADRRCEIMARVQLAMIAGRARKLAEAIRSANAALADAQTIGDRWAEGYALSQRLTLYNWADDPAAVAATSEPTLQALRDSGHRQTLMTALTNLAIGGIEALELEKAEAHIVEAEGLARRVGSQLSSASIDRARGYLEQTRGDFDLARKSYTAGLEKARRAGVPQLVGNALADLAWLEVDADRPDPAAAHAREAVAAYRSVGDLRTAADTEAVLAWAEARKGNAAAARNRLAVLRRAAEEDGSDSAHFALLTMEARVAAATGDWPRAVELRKRAVRIATEWKARGLMIRQQANLADALHGAGDRRALEKLVEEILPEVERNGLRGIARELRALVAR